MRASRPRPANSSAHQVRAKKPRASACRSCSITQAPGRAVGTNRMQSSVEHANFGDRNHELAAPFADVCHLLHDLVLEAPREDEKIVGPGIADRLRGADRD